MSPRANDNKNNHKLISGIRKKRAAEQSFSVGGATQALRELTLAPCREEPKELDLEMEDIDLEMESEDPEMECILAIFDDAIYGRSPLPKSLDKVLDERTERREYALASLDSLPDVDDITLEEEEA